MGYQQRHWSEKHTSSKAMATLPANYFDDFSDSEDCVRDGSTSTTNIPAAIPTPCNPTTINELSSTTSSSNESTDANAPSTSKEETRVRRKKRKKASRKRARTPDETDEEEQRRLQRNARQRKRRADEKKNHQLTREKLAALENTRKSERVWKQQRTKILGNDFQSTLSNVFNRPTRVYAGSETYFGLTSGAETETTGYFTDTNFQGIDQSTYLLTSPVSSFRGCSQNQDRLVEPRGWMDGWLPHVSSSGIYALRDGSCLQRSAPCDTAESDYSGYLTDVSKDPFLNF